MKIILTRTVNYKGRYHSPDSIVNWPKKTAEALIDDGAAEPVMNVRPEASGEAEAEVEDAVEVSVEAEAEVEVEEAVEASVEAEPEDGGEAEPEDAVEGGEE